MDELAAQIPPDIGEPKESIVPVGTPYDGTPVDGSNYVGDPLGHQIGLLAKDVAPEAVTATGGIDILTGDPPKPWRPPDVRSYGSVDTARLGAVNNVTVATTSTSAASSAFGRRPIKFASRQLRQVFTRLASALRPRRLLMHFFR